MNDHRKRREHPLISARFASISNHDDDDDQRQGCRLERDDDDDDEDNLRASGVLLIEFFCLLWSVSPTQPSKWMNHLSPVVQSMTIENAVEREDRTNGDDNVDIMVSNWLI